MSREEKVFGEAPFEYNKIINCIFIGGLNEEQISAKLQNDNTRPKMSCLFCLPQSESKAMDGIPFEFLYPNEQYELSAPKFFSMTFTNEKGIRSYVYCFKLTELYDEKTYLPLVIGIKSYKHDINAFKDLFEKFYQIINKEEEYFVSHLSNEVLNYRKIELLNILAFCTEMIKPAPHTNIRLVFGKKQAEGKQDDSIDFYFSSNCEIPCNKNDSEINVLFSVLDLEIIIKLVILILSERQILIIASDAPLLYMIFPALLKLIFPFKWIHAYLPLLPSDQFAFLDAPVSYLIGVLSRYKEDEEFKEILERNDSRVIVDCDSNEIFGYKEYSPYLFKPINDKNTSERLLYLENSDIYGYDLTKKSKTWYQFPSDIKKVIIDCQNNKMLCDINLNDNDEGEWSSLRKKIQLAKNPNIFNLDDFSSHQNKKEIKIGDIKIDRPFSYNIQNIFLGFYHLKIKKYHEDIEDSLITTIKETNLFENFEGSAPFQNDSGAVIFKNIFDMKEERSYNNCYNVSYKIPEFPVNKIITEFKKGKIQDAIEKILNDYKRVKSSSKQSDNKFNLKYLPNSKKIHRKNTRSILEKSHKLSTFNFTKNTNEESEYNVFRFYGENGFIKFVNDFFNMLKEADIPFFQLCYESQIVVDIISSIKREIEEIRALEIANNQRVIEQIQNQLQRTSINEEETDSIIDISRESFRYTKGNCSIDLNIPFEEEEKLLIDFNEELKNAQYYLFLANIMENIPDLSKLIGNFGISADINEIILQLYIKAYTLDQREFPLYRFNLFMEKYLNIYRYNNNPVPSSSTVLHTITERILNEIKEKQNELLKNQIEETKEEPDNSSSNLNEENSISSSNQDKENQLPFDKSPEFQNKTFTDVIHDKISIVNETYSASSSMGNKTEEYYQKIIINNKNDFIPEAKPVSINIINQIGQMMWALSLSIDSNELNAPYAIINKIFSEITDSSLKELVAELAILDLFSLKQTCDKISFWLNCYNYLLLFTLFYKKWIINKESDWKRFFKNVYYIIGGLEVSFTDMQYIILKRVIFFQSDCKPSESLKSHFVGKIADRNLLTFLLYLPTGITLAPKVYTSNDFNDSKLLIDNFKQYIYHFFKLNNQQNTIAFPEFLNFFDSKWLNKLQEYLPNDIINAFKEKKKKKIIKATWNMDFSLIR